MWKKHHSFKQVETSTVQPKATVGRKWTTIHIIKSMLQWNKNLKMQVRSKSCEQPSTFSWGKHLRFWPENGLMRFFAHNCLNPVKTCNQCYLWLFHCEILTVCIYKYIYIHTYIYICPIMSLRWMWFNWTQCALLQPTLLTGRSQEQLRRNQTVRSETWCHREPLGGRLWAVELLLDNPIGFHTL